MKLVNKEYAIAFRTEDERDRKEYPYDYIKADPRNGEIETSYYVEHTPHYATLRLAKLSKEIAQETTDKEIVIIEIATNELDAEEEE